MPTLTHLPLGQRIPDVLHAVSVSLPTMCDVIGYEEKDPDTTRHITSGYPRFVQHPLVRRAAEHLARELDLADGQHIWPTASLRAAEELHRWLALEPASASAKIISHDHLAGVALPENSEEANLRAKMFLRHTGTLLSSREAEDYLVRAGQFPAAQPEPLFSGDASACVKGVLAGVFAGAAPADVFLANTGMNAVHAAFRAVDTLQRARGRTRWLQLGWLYPDTAAILQKFTAQPARDYHFLADPTDTAALKACLQKHHAEIAGIITETPGNPLLHTCDLAAVAALCRAHGIILIADPTTVSPLNIEVFPHADIAINSLTKYTASEGDVIAGAVILNPQSPHAAAFRAKIPAHLEPPYPRDLARLAAQIGDYAPVIAQTNRTARAVVEFLQTHPAIDRVYWTLQSDPAPTRNNYLALARSPDAIGSMIAFTLRDKPLAWFYDRVRLAKGPSFGMKTTLLSPFIYTAHYALVKTPAGRETLRAAGVPPEILRLSLGCEPAGEILAALAEALAS